MKIVYIYEDGFTSNNGSNHLHQSIIKKMLDEGFDVHLIQSSKDGRLKEYPNELKHKRFSCSTIVVKNVKKTDFFSRYFNGLNFCYRCKKIIRDEKPDLFFIQSAPTVSFNINFASKTKKPIIYNIYDVFPGSAKELGIVKIPFLYSVLKRIQRIGYRKASKIVVMSEDMKRILVKEKVSSEKIAVIHNWYNSDSVCKIPNDENTFVKDNHINLSKIIVQYAGNIGQVFGLEETALLINLLKEHKNIEFHIIGEGVKLEKLKEKTKDCDNVLYFGWQPQEKMSEIYSYCNFELIPLHHGVIGNNVPSKAALSLACGKPLLCIIEESNFHEEVNENGIGFCCSQNRINQLVEFLEEVIHERNNLFEYESKCINYAKNNYDKMKNLNLLIDIVKSV